MTDMGSAGTVRTRMLEKQREQAREDLEVAKEKMKKETTLRVSNISDKFASKTEGVEERLGKDTIGLVTAEEFKKKREHIQANQAFDIAMAAKKSALESAKEDKEKKKKRKKKHREMATKLSFGMGDDDEEEEEDGGPGDAGRGAARGRDSPVLKKAKKVMKNPHVDSSFLPDRHREEEEMRKREELKNKWIEEQQRIKKELLEITYSYWDGSGHRRTITVTKGTSIGGFLSKVQKEFKELRHTTSDALMYIKEDLIIPHHYTFYDLIVTKARGKSGPLFSFDVHEDVRLKADARKEKDESHAGKVCERRWYESNKHIFPASRWEVYDPAKKWDKYTIHGGEVN